MLEMTPQAQSIETDGTHSCSTWAGPLSLELAELALHAGSASNAAGPSPHSCTGMVAFAHAGEHEAVELPAAALALPLPLLEAEAAAAEAAAAGVIVAPGLSAAGRGVVEAVAGAGGGLVVPLPEMDGPAVGAVVEVEVAEKGGQGEVEVVAPKEAVVVEVEVEVPVVETTGGEDAETTTALSIAVQDGLSEELKLSEED